MGCCVGRWVLLWCDVCVWGGMFPSLNAYRGKPKNVPEIFFSSFVLPSFISPSSPPNSDMFWPKMLPQTVLEVFLHYSMGFIVQVPHYFNTNSSLDTPHLPHFMLLARRTWWSWDTSDSFNQLFWFSVEICVFQWKEDIFHILLSVKSSGVLSKYIFWWNFFNQFHMGSWSWVLWEKSSFSLG